MSAVAPAPGAEAVFSGVLQQIDGVAAQLAARPTQPVIVRNGLDSAFAERLADELKRTDHWERQLWVRTEGEEVGQVDAARFEEIPASHRFSASEMLPHQLSGLPFATILLRAAADATLARAFAGPAGEALQAKPWAEFTRYQQGDFLAAHSDPTNDRRVAMVAYLTREPWKEPYGGDFWYRNEAGEEIRVEPDFNTVAMFPLRTDCSHWVRPVTGSWSRHGVALHFMAQPPASSGIHRH